MLDRSAILSRLDVIVNKLSQVTSFYYRFDCNFLLEAFLSLIVVVVMISTVLVLVPFLWWDLQFA